jgi:alpha-1,2-mannosyltransferase
MALKGWSSSIRAKLWKGWFLLALLITTLLIASYAMPGKKDPGTAHAFGLDFIAFYRAGELVHSRHAHQLYDLQNTQNFDRELAQTKNLALGETYGAYLNPPFFAWIFAPLVSLGYWKSLIAWEIFNLLCVAAAAVLLCRIIPPQYDPDPNLDPRREWQDYMLVPALLVVSLPFIQTIGHAQNTFLSLLLMTWAVVCWRGGRAFYAGIAAGLLFYKPQLAAVILLAMVITLGWRALAGAALTVGLLLAINILTLPGTLTDYFHHLGPNVQTMLAGHPYLWQRHVTLNGFWHLSLGGAKPLIPPLTIEYIAILSCVPVAFGVLLCIWRNRKSESRDRMIAAVITAAPLLMPYYLDYDLLLLAVPAVLLSAEMVDRDGSKPMPKRDAWLIGLWLVFFLLLLVNPGLTKTLQVNLSVPLLVAIAGLMIARSLRTVPAATGLNSINALNSFQWPVAAAP